MGSGTMVVGAAGLSPSQPIRHNASKIGRCFLFMDFTPGTTFRSDRVSQLFTPPKALFMTVWRPSTRSAENSCGIRQG